MDIFEALARWRAQVEKIQRQIDVLLAMAFSDEQHKYITIIHENAGRFIQMTHECAAMLVQEPAFNLNQVRFELMMPVTPITGFARMLLMPAFGEISAEKREILQSIEQNADTIAHEIHEFFVRPDNL